MNKKSFINELILELSYRSEEGYPNFTNPTHIAILSEILDEWGLSEIKDSLIKNISEAKTEDDKYVHKAYGYYVRVGDEEKDDSQKYKKENDKYIAVSQDEYDTAAQEQGESGGDTTKSTVNTTQQVLRGQSLNPSTQAGKDYLDSLPPNDPAKKLATTSSNVTESESISAKFDKLYSSNDKIQNNFIKSGFKIGAAPGNAGSMYNEIMSCKISEYFTENPNASESDAYAYLKKIEAGGKLAKQNDKSQTRPGKLTAKDTKPYEGVGDSNEIISKRIIAIRSAKRKAKRIKEAKNKLKWENTKVMSFYGDSNGLKALGKSIALASGIVDQRGNPIPKSEALEFVKTSGGGDNPSDTATLIMNTDNGVITLLFHSDKDSTGAIIGQSTFSAEIQQTDDNIYDLVNDGKITGESAKLIRDKRKQFVKKVENIEKQLNNVTAAPAIFLRNSFGTTIQKSEAVNALKKSKDSKIKNYWISQIENRFAKMDAVLPPKDSDPKKFVSDYLQYTGEPPTDSELLDAYIKWCSDEVWIKSNESLSKNDQNVINYLNTKFNGPDVSDEIDRIRRETIEVQEQLVKELDFEHKIEINGKEVGIGTYLEAKNIWQRGHFDMIDGDSGVFKYKGMFEINNGGIGIGPKELKDCANIEDKDDFFSHFEVGTAEDVEAKGGGNVTGSKKLVYAVSKSGKRVPIIEKRQRSKNGTLGRLNSVYNWSKQIQQCFDSKK